MGGPRRPWLAPSGPPGPPSVMPRPGLNGAGAGEREPRHPVDRGAQVVVADPLELALDDDVADGEQAAGLDASERADREERGRLHLDAEHAALRPALVLAAVRVV